MTLNERNPSASTHWQHQLDRFCKQENLKGLILSLYQERKDPIAWIGASGNLNKRQPYFISGLARLHIAALLIKLKIRGKVNLDEPFRQYLTGPEYAGIGRRRGTDRTPTITLKQLLTHQSGIPDYLRLPIGGEKKLKDELFSRNDREWTFAEVLQVVRNTSSLSRPGASQKPHPSETNFLLLGKVIEKVTALSLEGALETFQTKPLAMTETYVYKDPYDRTPTPFYNGNEAVHIPRAMASFGAAGGMVSTAQDCMTFLKSYLHGKFFPPSELDAIFDWQRESASLSHGLGICRYQKPLYTLPWGKSPAIIGQTGITGAFSFFVPDLHLYLTGTVNQSDRPLLPYKLARFILHALSNTNQSPVIT